MRHFTPIDKMVMLLDQSLRAVHSPHQGTARPNPASRFEEAELSDSERKHVVGLMRVNHAGEIAAQALYNGQALTARDEEVRERMQESAVEETDHLAWCKTRVNELGGHTSLLGPFWYWGSFAIGAAAGLAGDKWSLGFVKETEDQVGAHLEGHLKSLPEKDQKSRAIVEQMAVDEAHHGDKAVDLGGVPLPAPIKGLMQLTSRVMTTLSYRV
ncbi:MAG TPA: 2-polyprenyl-3-methyl-6-methoxy-1,4-benzoquinone monooxygenase [Gammaproteobacteria bacterium]|nr:2-polyprenyl-3-methyl-6-methoxy-1,4-benzoquinone monooxygenase [Gammaproteobacteria bacterium]